MTSPFEKFSKPSPEEADKSKFEKFSQAQQEAKAASPDTFAKFQVKKPGKQVPAAKTSPTVPPKATPAATPSATSSSSDLSSFLTFDEAPAVPQVAEVQPFEKIVSPVATFPRMSNSEQKIFTHDGPQVVALNKMQSGVGLLEVALTASADFTLSLWVEDSERRVFPITDGIPTQDFATVTPSGSVLLHLRHVDHLRRALVVVTARSPESVWEGALTATFRRARITASLEHQGSCENFVALSLLQVEGELVLRFEHAFQDLPLRDVVESFGYNAITWKNNRIPLL